MKNLFAILAVVTASLSLSAQTGGGEMPFTFINIPVSPVSQALSTASAARSSSEGDIINPASLGFNENRQAVFTYQSYLVSSYFGLVEYSDGSMKAYLKYFNSGSMERRDSLNNYIGDFALNMLYAKFEKAFRINDNMYWGAGVLAGAESSVDYNNAAAAAGAGIIYRGYKDFLNFGFYADNLGVSYCNSSAEMLPARVLLGVGIEKENVPVSVYIDAGKILDRDYFYAAGVEIDFTKGKTKKRETADEASAEAITDIPEIEAVNEQENLDLSAAVDSASADADTVLASAAEEAKDSVELKNDNTEEKVEYQSYAEWIAAEEAKKDSVETADALKEIKGETESSEKSKSTELVEKNTIEVKKEAVKGPAFTDDIKFIVRGGFSSDREELQMGTGLDLVAGLTAGFTLGYRNIAVDYSVKQFGEVGVTHSIGIKYGF